MTDRLAAMENAVCEFSTLAARSIILRSCTLSVLVNNGDSVIRMARGECGYEMDLPPSKRRRCKLHTCILGSASALSFLQSSQ